MRAASAPFHAVVHGAAGGIGVEVVRILFARGARTVIGVDERLREPHHARAARASVSAGPASGASAGGSLQRFVPLADVGTMADEEHCDSAAIRTALEEHCGGELHALICIGGGNPPGVHNTTMTTPANTPIAIMRAQMDFNLHPNMLCLDACSDALVAGKGSVVLTSSVNATTGIGELPYSASKAALHPLAANVASHFGPLGVNCNAVALGTVGPTGPWLEALKSDPQILQKIGSRNPRGQVGTAEEAAEVLVWLASAESRLVNGQVITADGGWTKVAGTVDTARPGKNWFD